MKDINAAKVIYWNDWKHKTVVSIEQWCKLKPLSAFVINKLRWLIYYTGSSDTVRVLYYEMVEWMVKTSLINLSRYLMIEPYVCRMIRIAFWLLTTTRNSSLCYIVLKQRMLLLATLINTCTSLGLDTTG